MSKEIIAGFEEYLRDRDAVERLISDPSEEASAFLLLIDIEPKRWSARGETYLEAFNGDLDKVAMHMRLDMANEMAEILRSSHDQVDTFREMYGPYSPTIISGLATMALYDKFWVPKKEIKLQNSDQDETIA